MTTYDDLTQIKGIGETRAKWFARALNVKRFDDLARLTVDEIETQLKAENLIASRRDIATWITRAQELSRNRPAKDADGWNPLASFVVEFQARPDGRGAVVQRTVVHHVEADHSKTWDGIECEELCQWMLHEADLPEITFHTNASAVSPDTTKSPLPEISILDITVYQPVHTDTPVGTGKPGHPFLGSIRQREPFQVQATLEIPSEAASRIKMCQASFYAYEKVSGQTIHLGDSAPVLIQEGIAQYQISLEGISPPKGLYRMQIYTSSGGQSSREHAQEIPFLQVVEG